MITHDTQIRVLYRDTDKMGVVYHANYIVFYEAARNEMFRAIGLPYTLLEQMNIAMPIVEVESKYKSPAYYDDLLTVRATVKELPEVRAVVEYEVFNELEEQQIKEYALQDFERNTELTTALAVVQNFSLGLRVGDSETAVKEKKDESRKIGRSKAGACI